ncbi:uncharacterized protein BCR38DRAFT_484417 [Pseudomassariella vexata]|uniref:FAD-binding PCMH-type domain-containing protein n=1 Tax=Pseudomassariella vexata TaxID=1141098 RepID=A0A1Y2E0R1_9PEZI|nr:uncharacterized protein BCR38DRAFT_484417 [Pseudomassariella vexata]ORY64944.1 hypothetical protein BCR38DRAFT_484417 [Pseudomassariella vexata]
MQHTGALAVWALCLIQLAFGQTIDDGGITVDATSGTVAPAVEEVAPDSAASGVEYLDYETAQLTPDVVANLTSHDLTDVELFDFGDEDAAAVASRKRATNYGQPDCKTFPGDLSWPSTIHWKLLNILTGGALIKAVPTAAPCYKSWPQYNAVTCDDITAKWTSPKFQLSQPVGIDFPLFEGVSCMPPTVAPPNSNCTLGGTPSYVVKVRNVAQIQLAVNFARNLNLRLNVKNKGHDFNAKSTGAGSLSVWTNFLQDIQYLGPSYSKDGHKGPAFKVGAGVEVMQMYEAADALNLVVVGGIGRTVGLGGGYIAGGGHSPLMSTYGLGADQVLSMEVVLPNGRFVSVDEKSYPDLFFALRGGGGGTYGIVTSLVIRAYPKTPVTTLTYTFGTGPNITNSTFWQGMDVIWSSFPRLADTELYAYWSIGCASGGSECSFSMGPQWANNMSTSQLKAQYEPVFAQLADLDIAVSNVTYIEYDGLKNAFDHTLPANTESVGGFTFHTASRLFPRANWEDPAKLKKQSAAIHDAIMQTGYMIGYNFKSGTNPAVNQKNAVNPAWRNTLCHGMFGAAWNLDSTPTEIAAANKRLVEIVQPLRDVSPGAGAYMNEADINEPDWQQSFYGSFYDRLYGLKQRYDPWGLLYADTAVGSEDWYITDQIDYFPTQNGRLCRK